MSMYLNLNKKPAGIVHLINAGDFKGTPAERAQVGDYRVYNYGELCEIIAITTKGKQSLNLTVRAKDGKEYTSPVRKTTLLVLSNTNGRIVVR